MSKHFRLWKIDQVQLLPPSVQDFVPKDHLSRFIVALVRESLDLGEIEGAYASALGQPPFDPRMMTALLLNGYANGIYSSRRIAKACAERADFMMIAALDGPDFRTISDFRKRHLKALAGLFVQVLKLAEKAGLVKLGHVALDGTKIKANASTMTSCTATHAAMRCPTGSPTSRSGSRRSAPPRRRWKRTPKLPPPKRRGIGPRSRTSARRRAERRTAGRPRRRATSPSPRRNATSRIPTAACCSPRTAISRAITRRRPSTGRPRSSSPTP